METKDIIILAVVVALIILAIIAAGIWLFKNMEKGKELESKKGEALKENLSCLVDCYGAYNQCEGKATESFGSGVEKCLDAQEKCKLECQKKTQ